jgi:hypothetical protein
MADDLDPLETALTEHLRSDQVPATVVEASRQLFTWRTVDAELAELLEESALTGVRGSDDDRLTFAAGDARVVVRVTDELLVGQVEPAPLAVRVDEVGRPPLPATLTGSSFTAPAPRGPTRIYVQLPDRTITTDWF